MTFHNIIFVVFVFDKISKGMLVTIEKELGEYFQRLHFWNQWVPLIKMHCRVRYLFDFDLKIRSGQVWGVKKCQNLTFKVNFLRQKLSESFWFYFSLKNMNLRAHFLFLKTLLFKALYFLKWCPVFDSLPLRQKSLWFCIPHLKTPQPILPGITWTTEYSCTVCKTHFTVKSHWLQYNI
jgi:hypothetical protein